MALEAGEKRPHESTEPAHKIVKIAVETQTEAASALDEMTQEEIDVIKKEFIELIQDPRSLSMVTIRRLTINYPWIISTVLNNPKHYSLVQEIIKTADLPLLHFLRNYGMKIDQHTTLFSEMMAMDSDVSPHAIEFMLNQKLIVSGGTIANMVDNKHYSDDLIEKLITRHRDILNTESIIRKHAIADLLESLIRRKNKNLLLLVLRCIEPTNVHNMLDNALYIACADAIESKNLSCERRFTLDIIRLLLVHGANPLAENECRDNSLVLAQQENDQELANILNSYAVQQLTQ